MRPKILVIVEFLLLGNETTLGVETVSMSGVIFL